MFFKRKKISKKHKPYEFIDFRFSATQELLAQNQRKYRTVFDEHELINLETELSFYNKWVDEDNWTASILISCFLVDSDKSMISHQPICQIESQVEVLRSEPICHVYHTWEHNQEKNLWNKNYYLWKIFINNEWVADKYCIIQDIGSVTSDFNPYFKVLDFGFLDLSILPHDVITKYINNLSSITHSYVSTFSNKNSHLNIGIDFCIYVLPRTTTNKLEKQKIRQDVETFERKKFCTYHFEFFFNIYDQNNFLKHTFSTIEKITPDNIDNRYHVFSRLKDLPTDQWIEGTYRVEVVFMDTLVAINFFQIGSENVFQPSFKFIDVISKNRKLTEDLSSSPKEVLQEKLFDSDDEENHDEQTDLQTIQEFTPSEEESLQELLDELDSLVGLQNVKKRIYEYVHYIQFLKVRQELGFQENNKFNLHSVFIGNPGTGKTTVAKLIGKIYHKLGLLSDGTLYEVGRAELIGQYIGQTAPKVKDVIEHARGGVLFIDEAYSLMRSSDDDRDYGNEAIEVLLKEMSDGCGNIAIFVAGYPKEMNVFLDSNPGLRSRFNLFLEFDDYLPQELIAILDRVATQKGVNFTQEATHLLHKHIIAEYRKRNKTFGNARFVEGLLEEAKRTLGMRVMKNFTSELYTRELISTITESDINQIIHISNKALPNIPIDEQALKTALDQLDKLIGLEVVKKEIAEIVQLVRFYKEINQDVLSRFSLHTVFKGNPGTGKTTVARLIADIYKALGILERGHLVEVDRQSLVAGFVGQTALKTQEMIDRAKGGVLFIDEAYALSPPDAPYDFGNEAIETLLKAMEDYRHEFAVIVAGYPDEMTKFLQTNPGLQSRFDRELYFDDLTTDQLYTVATDMLATYQLTPDSQAQHHLKSFIKFLSFRRDKFFGNARTIRKVIERAVRNQHLRMANLPTDLRTETQLTTLTIADVAEFTDSNRDYLQSKQIGF